MFVRLHVANSATDTIGIATIFEKNALQWAKAYVDAALSHVHIQRACLIPSQDVPILATLAFCNCAQRKRKNSSSSYLAAFLSTDTGNLAVAVVVYHLLGKAKQAEHYLHQLLRHLPPEGIICA